MIYSVNAEKTHRLSAQVEQYNGILSRALDKHAPVKQRSITLHHNSPWYTDAVRAAKKKRRQIENKWRRTHLEIDRQLYCEQKKLVIHLIERAKSNYYNELFADHSKDQKQIYRLTDKPLHKNKSSPFLCTSPVTTLPMSSALSSLTRSSESVMVRRLFIHVSHTALMGMHHHNLMHLTT